MSKAKKAEKAEKVFSKLRFHKGCPIQKRGMVEYVTVNAHAMYKAGQISKGVFARVIDRAISN